MQKYPPKDVTCHNCGHVYESDLKRSWCGKCCRPVYYHEAEGRKERMFNNYMWGMTIVILLGAVYMLYEFVAEPILALLNTT